MELKTATSMWQKLIKRIFKKMKNAWSSALGGGKILRSVYIWFL